MIRKIRLLIFLDTILNFFEKFLAAKTFKRKTTIVRYTLLKPSCMLLLSKSFVKMLLVSGKFILVNLQ